MSSRIHVLLAYADACDRNRIGILLGKLGCRVTTLAPEPDRQLAIPALRPKLVVADFQVWASLSDPERHAIARRGELKAGLILLGGDDLFSAVYQGEFEADDYIRVPVSEFEFSARIGAAIKRLSDHADRRTRWRFADRVFDEAQLELIAEDGRRERLTAAEGKLLQLFLRSPNRILSRDQLLCGELGDDGSFERSVDVLVSRLRRKLEGKFKPALVIRTVYGEGYLLNADVEEID